ncbi:hypothetical protein CKM354_000175400 [Cercospora kikuchii]|uniref:Uncharacterized protein n=1 Tax=Cercospora kikuchii TaxID=84275 RepID=A0A9P3C6B7_9PEZI|nr:uncharacterized protein CKM354_000175400 [Cercospora kikuchii]GIZ38334.1 hypothetical protein CKM354_000175400 [Cercospora kikuchii]
MPDQRNVTPFEQQVFDLLAREDPPHPVILSQLVASMDLRYITRFRSSIDGERMNMLLCAAAEMHSTATGALANSTFKMNEEASDAASRSSSENASSVDSAAPACPKSSGNKTAPQDQVTKAHERYENESEISFAKPTGTIPLSRGYKAKAVTVSTPNSNDAKDASEKHELGGTDSGMLEVGKQARKETGSDKVTLENEVQKHDHHTHSPHRSLEELDAELEKMQSKAAKVPVQSDGHSFWGERLAQQS